ncbi:hypothetical protein ACHAWT_004701 [Skeletonema menzelii]
MDSSSDEDDIIVIDDSSDDGGSNISANDNVSAAHPSEPQIENTDDSISIADEMDLTMQSFLAARSPAREPKRDNDDDDDEEEEDVIDVDAGEASFLSIASSASSSSSSGIPGPSPYNKSYTGRSHRPPLVIHTTSAVDTNNDHGNNDDDQLSSAHEADKEDNSMSVSSIASNNTLDNKKAAATTKSKAKTKKKPAQKRNNNANNRKRSAKPKKSSSSSSVNSNSIHTTASKTTASSKSNNSEDPTANKHFHCYLLRSLNPDHPLKTYIGFTTNPSRRIRQHNGILKAGGANKTKRAGRPWTFVAIIHGFQDKITALQFEWAWQNVDKSKAFREAVGDDAMARKMKRRMGPKARLDELRWLLKDVQPFCLYSLTVYFPEREYCEIFRGIVSRGKSGNPYKKDDDDESEGRSEMFDSLLDIQVSAVENMPFAREMVDLKEKKKALRQQRKEERQAAKKKKKDADAAADYSSDISSWLETLDDNDDADDGAGSWSDLLDESDDNDKDENANQNDRRDLSAIAEDDNSSVISFFDCDNNMRKETVSSAKPKSKGFGIDDISSTMQSLSIDGVSKMRDDDGNKGEYDDCDFSTISSADSDSSHCSMKHRGNNDIYKENYEVNKPTATPGKSCDFFDLCSP